MALDPAAGTAPQLPAAGPPGRLGVLVPPANPTVEPELCALAGRHRPQAVSVHAARLPVLPGPLVDRLAGYNDALPATLDAFGALRLDAVVFACTGSSYLLGPDSDRRRCAELAARRGVPMTTSAVAVLDCLGALGRPAVTLVSPYPDWLTDLSREFWQAAGIPVRDVLPVPGGGAIYDLDTGAVTAVLRRADPDRHGALLLTGTGMPTVPAIDRFAGQWPHPVLSSAVCGAWWARGALAAAGVRPAEPAPCLVALATHLAAARSAGDGRRSG
ncbi:MAG TPA: hypothetical protein VFX70_23160 [Mycobacteriales bacterium]|nr:hypothetical protein [Mycobacteriales bacterium]